MSSIHWAKEAGTLNELRGAYFCLREPDTVTQVLIEVTVGPGRDPRIARHNPTGRFTRQHAKISVSRSIDVPTRGPTPLSA